MRISPEQFRYLLVGHCIAAFAINFVLNGALGLASFRGVDPVPTWATGTKHVDSQVFVFYFYINFFGLGQNCYRTSRRVYPTLGLSLWHPLNSMDPSLVFKPRIHLVAANAYNNFFIAALAAVRNIYCLNLKPFVLCKANIHLKELTRKKTRLITPGASPYFQNHILGIVWVFRQK